MHSRPHHHTRASPHRTSFGALFGPACQVRLQLGLLADEVSRSTSQSAWGVEV